MNDDDEKIDKETGEPLDDDGEPIDEEKRVRYSF